MPTSERIGVVLAGGRSTRMGRDKARLVSGGCRHTWLEETLRFIAPHVDSSWVVGREVTSDDCPGLRPLPPSRLDRRPGMGPLAGLETALEIADGKDLLVAACDLPALSDHALAALVQAAAAEPGSSGGQSIAFAFRSNEPPEEPRLAGLLLLLEPAALPPLRRLLDRDERRVERFLRSIATRWLTPDAETTRSLRNANGPGDLP